MPRCPSGPYFTASTAARASAAVLTWGTWTPQAPRSRNGAMISGLLPTGRTIGAMPESSAAAMQASALSTVIDPCSLSSRIQSKPRCPSISTTAGEGKVHMTPNAALPAYSRCLSVFSRMAGVYAAGRVSGAAPALRQGCQRVVNALVDLDALAGETRALAISALAGNADLGHTLLEGRCPDRRDLRGQRAPIVLQWHEQVGLERDEQVAGALFGGHRGAQHAERVRRQRQRVALVGAERQERATSRGGGVRGRPAVLVDRHAGRQRDAQALTELQIRSHERGGAQIDHQRVALHREAEGDRIGAERGLGATEGGYHGRRSDSVDSDQPGTRRHLDVVRAAAAHPDVVDGNEREPVSAGALDHLTGRVVHPEHAALVAAVEQHRDARLLDDAHRMARRLEQRMIGDIEQLRQAGILVAAK